MQRKFIDMQFFGTYYFLNLVHNIGSNPSPYLRNLEGFWGDGREVRFAAPFPRISRLHDFAEFVIDSALDEDLDEEFASRRDEGALPVLWVERAMQLYGLDYESFQQWLMRVSRSPADASADDARDYFSDLSWNEEYDQLMERLTGEVFFHLFLNRRFLAKFNEHIAAVVRDLDPHDLDEETAAHFTAAGRLRRVAIPEWVRNAVFYRDRGMCVLCHADLTGIIRIQSESNYDHIVPLANGGINDVTNIQLLCGSCNRKEAAGVATTSSEYEAWY